MEKASSSSAALPSSGSAASSSSRTIPTICHALDATLLSVSKVHCERLPPPSLLTLALVLQRLSLLSAVRPANQFTPKRRTRSRGSAIAVPSLSSISESTGSAASSAANGAPIDLTDDEPLATAPAPAPAPAAAPAASAPSSYAASSANGVGAALPQPTLARVSSSEYAPRISPFVGCTSIDCEGSLFECGE